MRVAPTAFCIVILLLSMGSLSVAEKSPDEKSKGTHVAFVSINIRALLVAQKGEMEFEAIQRKAKVENLISLPKSLALQLNAIFEDKKLITEDPEVVIQAAKIAAAFRLKDCAPALVKIIKLSPKPNPTELPRAKFQMDESMPIVHALIEIGKPSIPHILALASSDKATDGELSGAGRVLEYVEGDLAVHVVEEYIKNSQTPETARKLLERYYFKVRWEPKPKPDADRKTGDSH
mgnify:CR=1 FL=1